MSINMKTLTQAFAKTAAVIEKKVQTTVQEVTGPKALQDYDLHHQIGSAGPGLAWKLYSAKARDSTRPQQYPVVCVWVLDKRVLSETRVRSGLTKAAEDAFLDVVRADAGRLVRLRHPGVVHVVSALDETKNSMAMVTEPLFSSAANAIGNFENIAKVPNELKSMEMGLLEVKHGLLQIAESLDFLHNNAHLIHRALSPENILITSSGAWKLGGFGFTIPADQSGDSAKAQAFHYSEYDVEDSVLPLQPSLNYTAPELVRSNASSAGIYSDIFSLGCVAYHLIARKPLFDCHNNVKMYMNTLNYLSGEAFSSIPSELVPDLQKMLSTNESFRPTALDFTASPFFRNDTRLRALRFLDHMLARDNMQKSEFLKALSDMWKEFDNRVLRYKVLPPLCAELRNLVMQPMILPMVLTIAESQDRNDFELITLPALVPLMSTAAGDTLLLLVKHADLIISKTSTDKLVSHILPLLVRAYDDNDARIQEEVLKRSASLAKKLDGQVVKQVILPRIHGLALKTTVAAVRVNALLCLGELVQSLDKHSVLEVLQTIQRCTAVDRSAPTLMCTLAVSNSILKQHGVEFAAEHVLPLLTPLLTAQQLNVQQFAKYMLFVKEVLRRIEEKRGVTITDSGIPEAKQIPITNGHKSQESNTTSANVASAARESPSWDEDWGSANKRPASSQPSSAKSTSSHSDLKNHSLEPTVRTQPPSASPNQSTTSSCTAVDIEWPPRQSSSVSSQSAANEKQLNVGGSPTSTFDDVDPFANWPPRTSGSAKQPMNSNGLGMSSSSINSMNFQSNTNSNSNNSWAFNNSSMEQSRPNQASSTLGSMNGGVGVNSQNSMGFLKQNPGIPTLGTPNNNQKATDLGSIFASNKNDQFALRLAPPPSIAVGSGRGRGRVSGVTTSKSSNAKSPADQQPSLLDLF